MTISVKMLNDSIKKISDTNSLLDMLIEFEKTLDNLDLYAYKNWNKGEVLFGPKLERHFVNVTLMYPYKDMPDPEGAKRLIARECSVRFEKEQLLTPRRPRNLDDVVIEQRPDGTQRYKAKTDSEPVWLVHIKMPRRFVDEFDPDIVEADEDSYVDMEDVDAGIQAQTQDSVNQTMNSMAPPADPMAGGMM